MKLVYTLFSVGLITVLTGCNQTATQTSSLPNQGSTTQEPSTNSYTLTDVATHNNEQDCWLVIDGNVYDVTEFIPTHPGGNEITKGCGQDATAMFQGEREHAGPKALELLPKYKIGKIN